MSINQLLSHREVLLYHICLAPMHTILLWKCGSFFTLLGPLWLKMLIKIQPWECLRNILDSAWDVTNRMTEVVTEQRFVPLLGLLWGWAGLLLFLATTQSKVPSQTGPPPPPLCSGSSSFSSPSRVARITPFCFQFQHVWSLGSTQNGCFKPQHEWGTEILWCSSMEGERGHTNYWLLKGQCWHLTLKGGRNKRGVFCCCYFSLSFLSL